MWIHCLVFRYGLALASEQVSVREFEGILGLELVFGRRLAEKVDQIWTMSERLFG